MFCRVIFSSSVKENFAYAQVTKTFSYDFLPSPVIKVFTGRPSTLIQLTVLYGVRTGISEVLCKGG